MLSYQILILPKQKYLFWFFKYNKAFNDYLKNPVVELDSEHSAVSAFSPKKRIPIIIIK